MNIILIGFMACGKTATGQTLAQELNYRFIDTDNLIEQENGMTIADIFAQKGEAFFRQQETAVLKQLSGTDNSIISTGGGIVLAEENRAFLKNLGAVIYLKAESEELYKRLANDNTRPLLNQNPDKLAEIKKILEIRRPLYESTALYVIETLTGQPETAAQEIIQKLELHKGVQCRL
jgi:shikimate kinase